MLNTSILAVLHPSLSIWYLAALFCRAKPSPFRWWFSIESGFGGWVMKNEDGFGIPVRDGFRSSEVYCLNYNLGL